MHLVAFHPQLDDPSQHLAGAYFEQVAGVRLTHVPYRNIAQYAPDLISGAVPLGFQWLPNVLATLNMGGANALAVAGSTRMKALPNVPTAAEAGMPNYQVSGWFVMLAPRGTPKPIVAKLNAELNAALTDPSVRERFTEQGAEGVVMTPDDLAKFMASETTKWSEIIAIEKNNPDEFIDAAEKLLNDKSFRQEKVEKGLALASQCGWENTVKSMQQLIKDAITAPSRKSAQKINPLTSAELQYVFQATQGS